MKLEDKDGLPWTASTGWGWIVFFVALTSGIAAVALALYLSLWIYTKGRSLRPLIAFTTTVILDCGCAALSHWYRFEKITDVIGTLSVLVWIAASFLLRNEIRRYYLEREDWELRIGPWFTLLFSAVYINYCLNPVLLMSQREKDTLISLNLSVSPNSAKIEP